MKVHDKRNLCINTGDIVIVNGEKYLVVYENSCIAWHFINLETMEFDVEVCTDLAPKLGENVDGLGVITEIVKESRLLLVIDRD